jgi:ferredoxin-NADP reductase
LVFHATNVTTLEQLGVPREADFYLCGPAGFLVSFIAAFKNWGVEPQRIHNEVFGPLESLTPGIAAPKPIREGNRTSAPFHGARRTSDKEISSQSCKKAVTGLLALR